MTNVRHSGLIRGLGGLFNWVNVLNRRLLAESPAEADAEALREVWEEVGGYLYDAMGAYSYETGIYLERNDSEWSHKKANGKEFIKLDAHFERTTGPIPPPGMLRGYEEVLPGSADRIFPMAEFAQKHRANYENRGLLYAFGVTLILIALSAFAISLGFAAASVGVIVASIAISAGTFIYSNQARRKDLRDKRAALQQPSKPPKLPDATDSSVD